MNCPSPMTKYGMKTWPNLIVKVSNTPFSLISIGHCSVEEKIEFCSRSALSSTPYALCLHGDELRT
jgi:hypothetical protein